MRKTKSDLQLDDIDEGMFLTVFAYRIPKTRQFINNGVTLTETETKPSYSGVAYKVLHVEGPFVVVEGYGQGRYTRQIDWREFVLMELSEKYVRDLEPRFFPKKKVIKKKVVKKKIDSEKEIK